PPCAMERQEYCVHRPIRHTPGVSVQIRYIRVQCSRRGREGTARLASVDQPRFPDEFGRVLGENPLMLRSDDMDVLALKSNKGSVCRLAQTDCLFEHRVEHRGEIAG